MTYSVEIATTPEFTEIIYAARVNETSHTVSALPNATNAAVYYWRVRAENGCGASTYSDVLRFYTPHIFMPIIHSNAID